MSSTSVCVSVGENGEIKENDRWQCRREDGNSAWQLKREWIK